MSDLPEGFEILFSGLKKRGQTEYCPRCRKPAVGVEIEGVYDGVCYWMCESCRVKWHRFGEDEPWLRQRVERYWRNCKHD